MATGDPPYDHMLTPNTLPCGCYIGVWMGVTPPPRCQQHAMEQVTTRPPPQPTLPYDGAGWGGRLRDAVVRPIPADTLNALFSQMGSELGKELGKAIAKGDDGTAERDLWALAMQALELLRASVDRARKP